MIDITKPRNFQEMIEKDEHSGFCCLNNMIHEFQLPFNVYLDSYGKSRKHYTEYCMNGTCFNYGEKELYTDVPSVCIEIDDYIYYASISKNACTFAAVPEKYNKNVKIVLNFVSIYHDILLLHWKRQINDCDLCDFLASAVITVEKSQKDYTNTNQQFKHICRKLRKLKKAKKYNGNI